MVSSLMNTYIREFIHNKTNLGRRLKSGAAHLRR